MDSLLSASEIAALKIPGLPTTKVGVRNMAEREQWYFEEVKGIGGTRRVYELPTRYYHGQEWEAWHSAGEIAAMNLPGLEGRSRVEIADIATKEGWPVRDIRTPGGSRRVYDVPGKYIEGSSHATNQASNVVGSIAAGSKDVDWDMMDLAMSALSEWEQERGIVIEQSRRSAIISVLYDYLVRGEADKLERVFKAIG